MIAEHLAQHGAGLDGREYFDMRGGCRSLSNFYQSCRYIKDCVAPTFWEVVVARDDVNIPERYMPLVKSVSSTLRLSPLANLMREAFVSA